MNLPFLDNGSGEAERTVLHLPLPSPRGGPVRRVQLLPAATPPAGMAEGAERRRARIWELGETLHCSIIGTCLSTGELRQALARADVLGIDKASDHELHILGVMAASRRDGVGRIIQKALDRRHRGTIAQFADAADAPALRALWDEAVRKGDIPGAYWAVLTHPAASAELVKHVFGEIHMLSHLVGAANRADIRRLRQLEEENAALEAKLARQQRHLREAFAVRDEAVRRLNAGTRDAARNTAQDAARAADAAPHDDAATQALIDDLNRRLAAREAHGAKLQARLDGAADAFKHALAARRAAEAECAAMRAELDLANERVAAILRPDAGDEPGIAGLAGTALLYVGGRAHQVPALRALVERSGGALTHHDGGIEDSLGLLPGLIGRADLVAFPVDCISHSAVGIVKRLCGQGGKRYLPLRTASLTGLLAALCADRSP